MFEWDKLPEMRVSFRSVARHGVGNLTGNQTSTSFPWIFFNMLVLNCNYNMKYVCS